MAMDERSVRRFFRLAGWFCILTITVLSLSPRALQVGVEFGAPQLDHLLAYLITTAALTLGHVRTRSRVVLCALLIGFGGLMELAQGPIPGRHADMVDLVVNTIGVGMGLATAILLERGVLYRAWR
jgi:VanZ family protein